MGYVIFDLDGTVIDTSHRYRNKPCGTIDLDYWFANSTPEMIARDALLPLATSWRTLHAAGHTIIVCTARSWERNELMTCDPGPIYEQFLANNDLPYHHLLYRNMAGPDHEALDDGALKIRLLSNLATKLGFFDLADMRAIMFDDNVKVIDALIPQGVTMFDAVAENRRLAA